MTAISRTGRFIDPMPNFRLWRLAVFSLLTAILPKPAFFSPRNRSRDVVCVVNIPVDDVTQDCVPTIAADEVNTGSQSDPGCDDNDNEQPESRVRTSPALSRFSI